MAISVNTGAVANANTASSVAIVIPAGVLVNDVMLMMLSVFTEVSSAPTIAFSGAGGSWTKIATTDSSANPQVAQNGTLYSYGYAYYRVATAGDPGATLTITETGSGAGTTWFSVSIEAYTGASTGGPIDVAGSASGGVTDLVQCPGETTGVSGDWAIYMGGGGANGTGQLMVGPTGATSRQNTASTAGIASAIFDSNGSVGGSGTSIGGTSAFEYLTSNHPNTGLLNGFTIGLAPAGATNVTGTASLAMAPMKEALTATETIPGTVHVAMAPMAMSLTGHETGQNITGTLSLAMAPMKMAATGPRGGGWSLPLFGAAV